MHIKPLTIKRITKIGIILLFLGISISPAFAQNEASVWSLGEGIQFNFNTGSPEISNFSGNSKANATICDSLGNLILYTDGITVWNRNNEILINGEQIISDGARVFGRPVFAPYPKKKGHYFLFNQYIPSDSYPIQNKKLVYAEININAFNGRGEVVAKDQFIHGDYHYEPTIAGFCNNDFFWIAIDRDNPELDYGHHRDIINFYKIDENGINTNPKVNSFFDIGNSHGYRFSPNGDKLIFNYAENLPPWDVHDVVADFNFLTGELYNYRVLNLNIVSAKEFSPDSKLLYYFSGSQLIQLNVDYSTFTPIMQSKKVIINFPIPSDDAFPGIDLQLAPDGKIYFSYWDYPSGKVKIGRINKPDEIGTACEPELDFYTTGTNNLWFPDFVTSFFRDNQSEILDEVFPDAGPELEICSRGSDSIGTSGIPGVSYQWFPEAYIEDPLSSRTVFKAPRRENIPEVIVKTLRTTDGNCWIHFDETQVTVLPQPAKVPIDGSWSVCPYVEKVDYWADDDNYDLEWLITGGEIAEKISRDSIKVDWWDTNFGASVRAVATNAYGCTSDTSVFPVRINVELITETPKGPEKLCIADTKNVVYQIRNTNGSVYDWFPENGEVVTGQGTNKVEVNWFGEGLHNISVKETSITIDTVCYGESEPLQIEVINDSLEIHLNAASFLATNDIQLNYQNEKFDSFKHHLQVEVENGTETFQKDLPSTGFYYRQNVAIYPETFRIKVTNSCGEIFYSNPQQSVVLKGVVMNSENMIQLTWNINQFWETNNVIHEIWYSENRNDGWQQVAALGKVNFFDFLLQGNSLTHFFRVKEVNQDDNFESWSNIIEISISDKLKIPDVFTPNSDGYNDEWNIENIQFHSIQRVVVFNKLGEVVYQCGDEFIPWDGNINGRIIQGTYFYQIIFKSGEKKYGQVTVLQ